MEGDGWVPDNFNTMGADEIEDMFLISQWELSRTLYVPTPYFYLNYEHIVKQFDKLDVKL